jgi:hypothetical protein
MKPRQPAFEARFDAQGAKSSQANGDLGDVGESSLQTSAPIEGGGFFIRKGTRWLCNL